MNKIYLDKLCDFALTTYNNYEHINNNFDLDTQINIIKQNQSLNEKGIFLKHNFVELKTLIPEIEYDQMVLLNPLCFNLSGDTEWFNFLNCLLTLMNDNYLHETNLIKKTILETADKTFKKKIAFTDKIDDKIFNNICILTNIKLFILSNQNKIQIFNNNGLTNKVIIMFNNEKEYYGILNWNLKYFNLDSEFVKYLIEITNSPDTNTSDTNSSDTANINENSNENSDDKFVLVVHKKKKKITNNNFNIDMNIDITNQNNLNKKNKSNKSTKLNNNMFDYDSNNDDIDVDKNEEQVEPIEPIETNIPNTIIKENIKNIITETNKITYNELQADENYAMYISDVIDTNTKGTKVNSIADKKKRKNDKNIFVTNKHENEEQKNDKNTKEQSSIFNKTEKLTKKDIEQISNGVKITMGLEAIQAQAIKLGINIFEGSTKTGKPKNKTKSDLIEQIKDYVKNYKD